MQTPFDPFEAIFDQWHQPVNFTVPSCMNVHVYVLRGSVEQLLHILNYLIVTIIKFCGYSQLSI